MYFDLILDKVMQFTCMLAWSHTSWGLELASTWVTMGFHVRTESAGGHNTDPAKAASNTSASWPGTT